MPILQSGTFSVSSLQRPGVYVDVQPPGAAVLSGVATNVLGLVGVGSWGPLNKAMLAGGLGDAQSLVGPVTNRPHDLSTFVAVAALQGASNFRLVRVSDGTDTAASVTIPAADETADAAMLPVLAAAVNDKSQLVSLNAATGVFTALYTGMLGNSVSVSVGKGSRVGSTKVVVGMTGSVPEVYDNLMAGGSPTLATYTLAGGSDGGLPSTAALLGVDGSPRTGAYALRGQGCAVISAPDCTDTALVTALDALVLSEGSYAVSAGPAGETIAAGTAAKASAGLDSWASKRMLGDWLFWLDATNGITRLISPAVVEAAELVSLAPNQSSLNKQLDGILGSQHCGLASTGQLATYADADIAALESAGIDVITNPAPGGSYWSCATGHNSSSDATRNSDSYTSMTNFLARTVNGGMGIYVGKPVTTQLLRNMRSTLLALFQSMVSEGLLDTLYGQPYSVVCDASNNPQGQTAKGIAQADVQVVYEGIAEKLLVNLQGGSSVVIASNGNSSIAGTSAA